MNQEAEAVAGAGVVAVARKARIVMMLTIDALGKIDVVAGQDRKIRQTLP